jgi:hypothetical protein
MIKKMFVGIKEKCNTNNLFILESRLLNFLFGEIVRLKEKIVILLKYWDDSKAIKDNSNNKGKDINTYVNDSNTLIY